MERPIRFFNFNVCSLVNTGRLQEIAWTLKPDIAALTGTRIRLPEGCSYTVQRLVGYTAIHNGWGRGCYTNRSTGVSIQLGKRFQPRMIKEISVPPSSLAGRGGAIRLRGGTIDLGILAYYSPPLGGCSRVRRKVQVKASQQLMDWVRNRISSWPSRVFPLAAGDLNSGVGVRITAFCSAIVIDVIVHCHTAGAPFESNGRKQLSRRHCSRRSLLVKLGLTEFQRSVPGRNLNSRRVPVKLDPIGPGLVSRPKQPRQQQSQIPLVEVRPRVCEAQRHDRVRCRSARDLVSGEGRGRQKLPSGV